jgi:hypothetical protein
MLESIWNLTTSEIELRQQLPTVACDSLISYLLAKRGVTDAKWVGDTRRLVVKYDADVFGSADLVDLVHARGIPVAAVRAGHAQARGTSSPLPLRRSLAASTSRQSSQPRP